MSHLRQIKMKKTKQSLNLNEKHILMFHSVSQTAHSKEILLVDSHNVEKILNEFHSSKQGLFLIIFF